MFANWIRFGGAFSSNFLSFFRTLQFGATRWKLNSIARLGLAIKFQLKANLERVKLHFYLISSNSSIQLDMVNIESCSQTRHAHRSAILIRNFNAIIKNTSKPITPSSRIEISRILVKEIFAILIRNFSLLSLCFRVCCSYGHVNLILFRIANTIGRAVRSQNIGAFKYVRTHGKEEEEPFKLYYHKHAIQAIERPSVFRERNWCERRREFLVEYFYSKHNIHFTYYTQFYLSLEHIILIRYDSYSIRREESTLIDNFFIDL